MRKGGISRPERNSVVFVVEDEVSLAANGEGSRGLIDRIFSVGNPHNCLNRNLVMPYPNIAISGIERAEEPKEELVSSRDHNITISEGVLWCFGIQRQRE